jgi:dipeptidyl aminopeptidase/acylaminoacyl peptidase
MVEKALPMPGETFAIEDHTAFLISPPDRRVPTPWVFYAPTLPAYPASEEAWMFQRFLDAGIAIAGIDVGESYGSPEGRQLFTALHEELVARHGLSKKACLLARSRGGLMLYNWAVEHPECVACVAGIYPVCNLNSYPSTATAAPAYGLTLEWFTDQLVEHNPIERIAPLAEANVPIFHIHGDSDEIVPLETNSGELARRYRALGGTITVQVVQGRGHDLWGGWFQCEELVEFVIAHASRR